MTSDTPKSDAAARFVADQLTDSPTDLPYYVLDIMHRYCQDIERELNSAVAAQKDSDSRLWALQDLIQRRPGTDQPFVCGHVAGSECHGLPEEVVICSALGSDVTAVYRRVTPVSGPEY
jgi:hypothetical protein